MIEEIFSKLNEKQKLAVVYHGGPSIILAGAGSGKTRVLVYKVIYLINHLKIDPFSIIMITFTNKAGEEMKKRIMKFNKKNNLGFIGTFHSFCAKVLRKFANTLGYSNNFVIYDEDDQKSLIKEILKESETKKFTADYFLNRISQAKNQLIYPQDYLEYFGNSFSSQLTGEIFEKYQKKLKANNAMDFDDLLLNTVYLWKKDKKILNYYQEKISYILVDEFQDTNLVQFELIKLLGKRVKNITTVGDFSQSIYSWRGADIENLKRFQLNFKKAKIFYLEDNYRSTQKILDFAYKIISKNTTHPILKLKANKEKGEDIIFYEAENEEDEALYVVHQIITLSKEGYLPNQMAVLYRTNAQSRIIEEAFLHYSLPYILIGGIRFYQRKEIKDILAFLRLVLNPDDEISLKRIKKLGSKRYKKFKEEIKNLRKISHSKTTNEIIEKIFEITDYLSLFNLENPEDYARIENIKELKSVAVNFPNLIDFLNQTALVEQEYSESEKKTKDNNAVKLMTIHSAKGLEFEIVFIIGVEEGILPHSRNSDNLFDLEEERRLFYVGITRAKKKLYITFTKSRFIFGKRIYSIKSRFIDDDEDF